MKTAIRRIGLFLFLALSAFGQSVISYIPQIADGGGWQTTIVVANTSSSAAFVSLSFRQETTAAATQDWNLAFQEGPNQSLSLTGGQTRFLHTLATDSATSVGWGEVIASGPGVAGVVAYAIFTQRIPARQDQDGTAAAAAGSARFLVPFDNSGGFITAVAVANPSSTGSINVNIQLDSGAISHGSLTLPDQGHAAFVLPDQFPETAGQRGLAEFYVTGAVRGTPSLSMLALRFNASGAFTTAPVYGQSGTPIIGVTQGGGAK
ncbi:MAG: hypothetical protein LAO79_14740 [Acidobacteriia bacterium]|nr:hypothetical protein [Terriglobia bacterium]